MQCCVTYQKAFKAYVGTDAFVRPAGAARVPKRIPFRLQERVPRVRWKRGASAPRRQELRRAYARPLLRKVIIERLYRMELIIPNIKYRIKLGDVQHIVYLLRK